jgi:uncharacterized delta-60 repeat protein
MSWCEIFEGVKKMIERKICCLGFAFLLSVSLSAVSAIRVQAAPGDLDPTFGFGGKISVTNGYSVFAASAAVQSDNKIVTAGGTTLARFTSNGLPDQSFGSGGFVNAYNFSFYDVKIQPDGKIVAVGLYLDFTPAHYLAVARFNANGTFDSSFGVGGWTYLQSWASSVATSLAIQNNGKLVGGGYYDNAGLDFLAARFNTNGTLDTTFSGDGIFTAAFNLNNAEDRVEAVAVQADGKILLAGYTYEGSTGSNFALMRLNSAGTLDLGFGAWGGRTTLNFSGLDDFAFDVVLQPDGKIVAAGSAKIGNYFGGSNQRFALARFNYNGSLDTTFDSGGKVTTSFGILSNDIIRSIALQTDGRLTAAGFQGESVNNNNFALTRYNTNGTPDTSFSGDGRLTTDFYGENDYANAIAIQSDGKIVAAGHTLNGNFYNIALARYLP